MRNVLGPLAVICALGAVAIPSAAAPSAIEIPRVRRAPRLDDFLENQAREAEVAVTDFRQREPHDGAPATRRTTAYLSYDSRNLYAVFVCQADRATLRARLSKRDNLFGDETVSVSLDTFNDHRRAYMFFSNALGVQLDGITTEGQAEDDFTFDTVWHSEGRLTSTGYIVLFAIPFRSLRFPPGGDWSIALSRYIPDTKEFSTYPRITNAVEGYVTQFAALRGLHSIAQNHNVQLNPYGYFASQRFLDDGSAAGREPFLRQKEVRAGIDAKAVLGSALTLDATVNPDFSQVESDEPQVTVNRRFEVFFPERRPFFIENSGYFETPETLFFSRRIVDPQFGSRLTGKIGRWSLGVLGADDRAPGRVFASRFGQAAPERAIAAVGRLQRDFGRNSMFGMLVTSRDFAGTSNRVYSADTRVRLNSNWVFTGQAIRSTDVKANGGMAGGKAFFAEIRESGRHLNYYTSYRDRSPDFHAGLGFVPRVNYRQVRNFIGYRWWPEAGRVLSAGPSLVTYANWDYAGRLVDWVAEVPFRVELKGPMAIEFTRNESYEFYRGTGLRKNFNTFYYSSDALKWLGMTASWTEGRDVNFYPAAGAAPHSAALREGTAGIRFRPTPRMRIDETYLYTRLAGASAREPVIFTNHVMRNKVNYQFTRTLTARWIVDYNGILPDTARVDLEREKRITNDLLFTWLLHPGTALHFGYTDRRENLRHDDLQMGLFTRAGGPRLSTGRQVFVKLSYLLRL